jgi:hypothetical protein
VVLSVDFPHHGLVVNVLLLSLLSLLLLLHLSIQILSKSLLLLLLSSSSSILHFSLSPLLFILIPCQHIVLLFLFLLHLRYDTISHSIHEFLSSFLSFRHFLLPILLLLVQHPRVLFLSSLIILLLLLSLLSVFSFISLILHKHLLKILLLLSSLLQLNSFFSIHLVSKSTNELHLLDQLFLLLQLPPLLLFLQLSVSHLLFSYHPFSQRLLLLPLLSLHQLYVLLCLIVVLLTLLLLLHHLVFLQLHLFLQLLLHQSLSLILSLQCCFLLLKVKQSIEFLNSCPLIVLIYLCKHLCWGFFRIHRFAPH